MRGIIILIGLLFFSNYSFSYPDNWENFNANSLNSTRDQTIGHTQDMIRERGSLECIVCHGENEDRYEGVLSTDEIMQLTLTADPQSCMQWAPVGICVWMTCTPFGCDFDFSVKVKNFVPDLVVQSYDRANGEPWTESQDLNQISQGDAESSWVMSLISLVEDFDVESVRIRGGVDTEETRRHHANLSFKLVDAYGSPGAIQYMVLNNTGYFCEGSTTPFFPYYISNLDAIAWRWDIPEMFYPQSWAGFVLYDLGSAGNNYGPIYPRHGFMTSQDPLKAAVLAAFRAAHFITRSGQPHLYFSIDESDEDGWWPPDPLDEGEEETGIWQMLYPMSEDECHEFPYGGNPDGERRAEDGSYIWNFWREYKCCEREGAILLLHTG